MQTFATHTYHNSYSTGFDVCMRLIIDKVLCRGNIYTIWWLWQAYFVLGDKGQLKCVPQHTKLVVEESLGMGRLDLLWPFIFVSCYWSLKFVQKFGYSCVLRYCACSQKTRSLLSPPPPGSQFFPLKFSLFCLFCRLYFVCVSVSGYRCGCIFLLLRKSK